MFILHSAWKTIHHLDKHSFSYHISVAAVDDCLQSHCGDHLNNMATSSRSNFERLAPELRLKIYKEIFTGLTLKFNLRYRPKQCSDCGFAHDYLYPLLITTPETEYKSQRSVLSVNKSIRSDAIESFRASFAVMEVPALPSLATSLKLVASCKLNRLIPSILLQKNSFKYLVFARAVNSTRSIYEIFPAIARLQAADPSYFKSLEKVILHYERHDKAKMNSAMLVRTSGRGFRQLKYNHLVTRPDVLNEARLDPSSDDDLCTRLNSVFDASEHQDVANNVKVCIRGQVLVQIMTTTLKEKAKLWEEGCPTSEVVAADIEFRRTAEGDLEPIRAHFHWPGFQSEALDKSEDPEVTLMRALTITGD